MAEIPCPNKIDCPGSDFPITNYSAEGAEQVPTFNGLVFPNNWDKFGCFSLCVSEVSQNAADLCALAQQAQCNPEIPVGDAIFYSTEQVCTCTFFGGAEFFYITPAGTFSATTQEAADAQAHAYACQHCGDITTSVRLGTLDACTCLGSAYAESILHSGVTPVSWLIIAGDLPDGLSMNPSTGRITGTSTAAGTFVFTVKAFLADGNYGTREYFITVLTISTTALTSYTLGEAYSLQLQAAGGSGSYAWKVANGTLPAGLTLSSTGLISGTPTAAGSDTIQFQVIDLQCEAVNQSYFTPLVSTSTLSLTTVRTVRGYAEYMAGGTGDLYKKVTYTGYARQTAYTRPSPSGGVGEDYCAGAQYLYSGSSEIDIYGNFISSHRKDLYVACTTSPEFSCRDIFNDPEATISKLLGYCWPADPQSCPTCSADENDWVFKRDDATHNPADFPYNIVNSRQATSIAPTTYSRVSSSGAVVAFHSCYLGYLEQPSQPNPIGFPSSTLNAIPAYYVDPRTDINYTATLSEPYTAQEAINSQLQYYSNSKTSENRPSYLTWTQDYINNIQSRTTSVDFTLACSNLVDGESYTVRYALFRSDGNETEVTVVFTASGTTHTVTGSLPTPPDGMTITLKNVSIGYTP